MKFITLIKFLFITFSFGWMSACSSGGGAIDKLLGSFNSSPILTAIPDQYVAEEDILKIDINNIKDGQPGNDTGMNYTCKFSKVVTDEAASYSKNCSELPSTAVTFSAGSGELLWTPSSGSLGNYKFKITGSNSEGSYDQTFTVGVRLKFSGIATYSSITGISVTATWTPNPAAQSYQIFKLNTLTGAYELSSTVLGGATSGYTITGLVPNTGYTFRVQAIDVLGNPDGNVISRSVTTTELVKLTMTGSVPSLAAGTATTINVQAFNANDTIQTVGGLPMSALIASGTSTGNFSALTDNNDGTYSFTFTPTIVGTDITIEVAIAGISFYLNSVVTIATKAGPATSANSSMAVASATVTSNESVLVTSVIRDAYNNPILSGSTITFSKTGGTSTGTFSAVTNMGSGTYTTTYSGLVAGSAQTLRVLVNATSLTPSTTIQVIPGAPVSATSGLTISSTSVSSGNSVLITATLKDVNSNPVLGGVMVGFNKSGGTSSGNFDSVTNAGSGTYTTTYTGVVSGTAQTISVAVDGVTLTPTVSITVIPGPASIANSSLVITNNSVVSGNFVTATATLKDAANNPIESGVTITFAKTGGTSTGTFGAVTNQGAGAYNIRYTGVGAGTSQNISVLIDAVAFGGTVPITVQHGAPSTGNSTLTLSSNSVSSGSAVTVTATLKDLNNNVISSGYAVSFAKSGGTSTGNFDAVTNAGAGAYTTTYTGVTAGSAQTISVLVDAIALGPTALITVIPGAPNSLLSTLAISSTTVIAGSNATLTATIKDANNNPISSGILLMFDKSGGTSFGNYDVVSNEGNGVYTVHYTGITAGTAQTVQANVNGAGFGPTQSIQVLVGAPSLANSSLTISSASIASGSVSTITAVIKDSQNNPITNQYTISFDAIGGSSTGNLSVITTGPPGTFVTTYTGIIAGSAQTLRVLADGTPVAGLTGPITVIPGAANAANSTFTIGSATIQSGSDTTLSIKLRDINSNLISSGATITIAKSGGTSNGTLSAVTNEGSGNYSILYTAATMGSAQTLGLVVNAVSLGLNVSATVTAGSPTHFNIVAPVAPLETVICNGPYNVYLRDLNENLTSSITPFTMTPTSSPVDYHLGNIYSDASCLTNVATNFAIPALTSSFSFYYKSYMPNSFTLTLTPSLGTISNGSIVVANDPVVSWVGASASFTMNGTGSNTVGDDSSGGFMSAQDVVADGIYLYVADSGSSRILKYNTSTNQLLGWLGHVGSTDGISTFSGSTDCDNLSITTLTPTWCLGGRSIASGNSVINALRNIAVDSTYIYVTTGNHRILRFNKVSGAFAGWVGKISTTAATSPALCVSAGTNVSTPTWCYGGTVTSGNLDGQMNNPYGITVQAGKIFVADTNNQRVTKWDAATGVAEGWVGNVNVSPQSFGGQLPTCDPIPASGDATPGWCLSGTTGTAKAANRYNLSTNPTELLAPNEGFYTPYTLISDGTYIYVGDASNTRIVRLHMISGAFSGWIGYNANRALPGNQPSPAPNASRYTSDWTTGGISYPSAGTNGFGTVRGLATDLTYLYISDDYHKISRVRLSDGQDYRWIGRVGTSPTGGYPNCSSTPISGATPGWCLNGAGNRYGNTNSTFYNPYGLSVSASKLYVADLNNFRVQRFDLADGTFDGWIGAGNISSSKWSRTIASTATSARAGIDDYSTGEITSSLYNGLGQNDNFLFETDQAFGRIKKFAKKEGSLIGYIGQISGFAPTGPESCLGYVAGMTPDWCYGGGRTTSNANIHGYNNPVNVAADDTYIYVADYSNHRVDRVKISDASYQGWVGKVSVPPTDGGTTCTDLVAGDATPSWCIGGSATSGTVNGHLNGPRAIYYDKAGNYLYVSDNSSRLIRINPADGSFSASLGTIITVSAVGCADTANTSNGWCSAGTGGGGANTYGGLNSINGIATNSNYIFMVDAGSSRVHRFNKVTGVPAGFIGRMTNMTNLDTSAGGGNPCAGLTGTYKTTPGWCYGTSVGVALNTSAGSEENAVNGPRGIWADNTYVYISDTNNNRVVRVDATTGAFAGWRGYITSTAGMTNPACIAAGVGGVTPTWCAGGTAGPGKTLGAFDYPTGLTGDANYLYVLDSHNNRTVTLPK